MLINPQALSNALAALMWYSLRCSDVYTLKFVDSTLYKYNYYLTHNKTKSQQYMMYLPLLSCCSIMACILC